jgi:hypothetical protein
MRKELIRITPKSVVKVSFFLGLAVNFIIGLFWGLFLKGAAESGSDFLPKGDMPFEPMTWAEVFILAIVFALAGCVMYAIIGWIIALLYNLIAHHFGGIEFHINEESSEFSSDTERMHRGTP